MSDEDITVRLDPSDEARLLADVKAYDRELSKALTSRIRAVAQPMGRRLIAETAPQLPRSGGLAYRIAAARGTVRTRTGVRQAGVDLGFTRPKVLRYIDQGQIPHPAWAQGPRSGWRWPTPYQSIRAGLITEAFRRNEPEARAAVEQAVLDAARTIRSGEVNR